MTHNPLLSFDTKRLALRQFTLDDADFIWRLMNDPDWLRYIGDRGVYDLASARDYIVNGPQRMYRDHGFGILKVIAKDTGREVGACGLLQRPNLQYPDIGFAFLPEARGKGYARESSLALLKTVADCSLYPNVEALVSPDNQASITLLSSMGFEFRCALPDFDEGQETHAYRLEIFKE
ncbi:MAG: GNAT family N-acetyltransferase [Aestuariibacter sp.]